VFTKLGIGSRVQLAEVLNVETPANSISR
jgi:hypothetical protein